MKRSEVLFWPVNFGLEQTKRLGKLSVETTKELARRQIELGQATLRILDPTEFVTHRRREEKSEKSRQEQLDKIAKDLRSHDPNDPDFPKLVRFSVPSMLKLIGLWAADGQPISADGIAQADRFLRDNNVPSEIVTASLEQLPREKNLEDLVAEIPDQAGEEVIYSPS